MDRKKLLVRIAVLMFFMFVLNQIGTTFYWYFSIWWFDILMHFWGGFWVGLFFLYVFVSKKSSSVPVFKVALWLLLVGVLWEFFEIYSNNFIGQTPFNLMDTLSDLCFDMAGGLAAIYYFSKKIITIPETTL